MKKKISRFATYLEQYPTITLFELKGIFGTGLLLVLMGFCALPLIIFPNQWVALFFASIIIVSDIWLYFDDRLWMPDFIKRISLSQNVARKIATFLQNNVVEEPSPSWQHFYHLNFLIIAIAAFFVGFIQPSGAYAFFMALSILIASFASLLESARLSLLSYAFFAFAWMITIL